MARRGRKTLLVTDCYEPGSGGRRRRLLSLRRRFSSRRRSRLAFVGAVGFRGRRTRNASRSAATSRSVASSTLRARLRSSCATARSTGPAFATTRRFCAGVSAADASTSRSASTRVSDVCACWPPGPLERENRYSISPRGSSTDRVTRIVSVATRRFCANHAAREDLDCALVAAILLDVDGVLHVSGRPLDGAADAVNRLRDAGHRLRFLTNTSTLSRARLAAQLRAAGITLDDDELQCPAATAARVLAGKRVLALTMPGVLDDLEGLDLAGDGVDAVLMGGADETPETNRVFSFMNLARAFAELIGGAELYAFHRNRWWQTASGPLLDSGAFVAGLEYAARVDAVVLGKPSAAFFDTALKELDADPELTWMVGDDVEADIGGAQGCGMRTVLVRTGKFRPDSLERSGLRPDAILSSVAQLPDWLEEERV
jgi:HAD superfamily hydrolase (TIGR01458 family)